MIDYDFYVNTYLGSTIPETAFYACAIRAAEALQRIRRRYQVVGADEMSEKMALCAMAETICSHHSKKAGVSSATVGGVSVRYEKTGSLQHQLLEKARIYLDIYRGVSPCSVP